MPPFFWRFKSFKTFNRCAEPALSPSALLRINSAEGFKPPPRIKSGACSLSSLWEGGFSNPPKDGGGQECPPSTRGMEEGLNFLNDLNGLNSDVIFFRR